MFEMICRVFKIAGNSRRKIVAGIVCNILKSFFNGFMMFGVFWILLHLDGLSPAIIGQAFGVILGSVLGRFFFQWMYDRIPMCSALKPRIFPVLSRMPDNWKNCLGPKYFATMCMGLSQTRADGSPTRNWSF